MRASSNRRLACLLGLCLRPDCRYWRWRHCRERPRYCVRRSIIGLADPAQIVAVSPDAADPSQSLFAAEATRYPTHRGDSEELVALQAELVLTDRWLPLRTSERLATARHPGDPASITRQLGRDRGQPPAPSPPRSGVPHKEKREWPRWRRNWNAWQPAAWQLDRRSPPIFCPMAVALAQALLSTLCCKQPARAIWQPPWVYRVGEPSSWSSWRSPNPI